jgi:hypothetical protein
VINLKPEIRLPLVGIFFLGILVPFFYIDKLGIVTSVCFSLASLVLFYVFALMPQKLKEEYAKLKVRFSPLWLYQRLFQQHKDKVDAEYHNEMNSWIGVAVFFLVLGIIAYAVFHS